MAVLVTAAVIAAGFVMTESSVGAATASAVALTCDGSPNDVASPSLGSSQKVVGLLKNLNKGAALVFTVNVTNNSPARVKSGSGPYTASFGYAVSLPASLVTQAKTTLGKPSLDISNIQTPVNYSGAANGTIAGSVPNQTVQLSGDVSVSGTVEGSINPTSDGAISYSLGTLTLSIDINADVAGVAHIGTLNLGCSGTDPVGGSTLVAAPGAPNVDPALISVQSNPGQSVNVDLAPNISPDSGVPVQFDTLAVTSQPDGGGASIQGTHLVYTVPAAGGDRTIGLQVCASPNTVKGNPGANDVQTLNWGEYYNNSTAQAHLNAQPLSVTLSFDGKETAPIQLAYYNFFGTDVPTATDPGADGFLLQVALSHFVAPSAATIQAALEKLPNIGAGNVSVTGGGSNDPNKPYTITFQGALAQQRQPAVTIGNWNTWLPSDLLSKASAILSGGGGDTGTGGSTTTTTVPVVPPTYAELDAQLAAGQIDLGQWLQGQVARGNYDNQGKIDIAGILGELGKALPVIPVVASVTHGAAPVADSQSPRCTPFTVVVRSSSVLGSSATNFAALVAWIQWLMQNFKKVCKTTRVKVHGKWTSRQTCTVYQIIRHTKTVCKTARVKVSGHWVRRKTCKPVVTTTLKKLRTTTS